MYINTMQEIDTSTYIDTYDLTSINFAYRLTMFFQKMFFDFKNAEIH